MDLEAVEGDFCGCFFNKTEVKENGGWEKANDTNMAVHDRDPIRCLKNCKDQFLETVSADYNETFSSVCTKLTAKGPNPDLWPLYWCDSTLCGVWIDQGVREGQDPNVDLIINQCQNIGYHSVLDPGPPPPNYTCITDTNKVDGSVGLCTSMPPPSHTSSAAVGTDSPAAAAYTSTGDTTVLVTQSGVPTRTTASSGAPVAGETALGSPTSPSLSAAAPAPDTDLSTGTKVAIALSSALGFLLVACLALFLLRRRHRHTDSALSSGAKHRIRYARDFPPPGSPTTPLIPSSATTRPPLTPPLRLRDRKFLPSILRQSRSPSPPLTPLNPVHLPPHGGGNGSTVFPSSPICSPTTTRLVPRHERTPPPKLYASSTQPPATPPPSSPPPPLPPLPSPAPAFHHPNNNNNNLNNRGSLGSAASTLAPSTTTSCGSTTTAVGAGGAGGGPSTTASVFSLLRNETAASLLPPPPPPPPQAPSPTTTTPTRPPRPHDAPLHIPDLVSPASPPPSRALPPRPPAAAQTPVGDGAEPAGGGGGWVGRKIRSRSLGRSQGLGRGIVLDLELGGGSGRVENGRRAGGGLV